MSEWSGWLAGCLGLRACKTGCVVAISILSNHVFLYSFSSLEPSKLTTEKVMDHSHMDHGNMGHGGMDHGGMDHGNMCNMNVSLSL